MAHVDQQIANPRTGQTMIFLRTAEDTDGQLLQIECFHEPRGPKEPVHTHPIQESRFEILAGHVKFQIDGSERGAGPGEVVTIPEKVPHCFWNDGEEIAHYLQEFRPALRSEHFFRTLFGLAREGKIDERGMPSPLALAVLVPTMGNVIRPTSPPWLVLRGLAWFFGPIARMRGYRNVEAAVRSPHPSQAWPSEGMDRDALRDRLTASREAFLSVLGELSDDDLRRPSGNSAWTVGAILTHLVWSLELLPREVAKARKGKGMYNFPRVIRDPLNTIVTRRGGRGQTLETLRRRYEAAYHAALLTLNGIGNEEFGLGARFWGEGFFDIASLYAAQAEHFSEHGDDMHPAVPCTNAIAS
jgi:quercetin dioxygenase-like cupin family protein